MNSFSDQPLASLASKYVNSTNRHIFLTGRAGTGKTTFLKQIVNQTHKKTVIAAPTGIAAINAGGITLHSLFHLPFGSFIPDNSFMDTPDRDFVLNTPKSLIKGLKMNNHKRKLLREIELIIIDEVSMLRADVLDEIDTILRYVRKKGNIPFGGVQLLLIGDLLQLPPVAKKQEWQYLQDYYKSVFFFESKALQKSMPVFIELEKIYRQSDPLFISILNNLRDDQTTADDLEQINQKYDSSLESGVKDGYIFITTHNHKADSINKQELKKLKGKSYFYDANIFGEFNENSFPVDPRMELRKGAQVMFIKNDVSQGKVYFNGKIGKIANLEDEDIEVEFDDGSPSVYVEKYVWENKRYSLNKETNEIDEKVLGTFSHYPLKLAWAITVHKSQGLTFEKAIIDVSEAFAPGQIYVALSRLTSLEGLLLNKTIPGKGLGQDYLVKEFSGQKGDIESLEEKFKDDSKDYLNQVILNSFDFSALIDIVRAHVASYTKDEKKSAKQKYANWAVKIKDEVLPIKEVADKFMGQIRRIIGLGDKDYLMQLNERVSAAIGYFEPLLNTFSQKILDQIEEVKKEKGVKAYTNELKELEMTFYSQLFSIQKSRALIQASLINEELSIESLKGITRVGKESVHKTVKEKKKSTKEITFELYKQGNSVEQIAEQRKLAESTIESHLARYVALGEIDPGKFISKLKMKQIMKVSEVLKTVSLGPIKSKLGDEFTYSDIRFALAYKEFQKSKE